MAVCFVCNQEMTAGGSCVEAPLRSLEDGEVYQRIKYGDEGQDSGAAEGEPCGDCRCCPGGYHHPGCDIERCPKCSGQALFCSCEFEPQYVAT
jgi:hypothetical protein